MSSDIRVMIIAAACAAVLSALTGVLCQVAFGALLLRALLSGAAFAALAAGALFIARKFTPELFGGAPARETIVPSVGEPDHRLNIVLPGETDAESPEAESLPPAPEPKIAGEADLRDLERDAQEIGTDTLVPTETAEVGEQPKATARPPASFSDLDVLPDLDGLSDSFTAAAGEDVDAGEPMDRDPISTTGASRDGVDAAAMASAVRTLLKRDQKGQ